MGLVSLSLTLYSQGSSSANSAGALPGASLSFSIWICFHSKRCLYRWRFGIETSCRFAGKVRGWPASPNPAYRIP
jgi:hypothetical protein